MANEPPKTDREILSHRIDEVPEHVRYHARNGFKILSSVPNDQFERFGRDYFDAVERGAVLESDIISATLEIDRKYVSDVTLATALAMGALADLTASSADFVEAGKNKIFDPNDEAIVLALGNEIVRRRTSLKGAFERSQISSSILPAFAGIFIEIDLRIRFSDKEDLIGGAPVAIVGLKTDTDDDLIFQMDADDLRRTIKRLEEAERRLRAGTSMIEQLIK
jgi:hypothetical protein